jgi:hypothetical protein
MTRPTLTIEYTTRRIMLPVRELDDVIITETVQRRVSELARAQAERVEEEAFLGPGTLAPPPERHDTLTSRAFQRLIEMQFEVCGAEAARLARAFGLSMPGAEPPAPALPKEGRMSDTLPSFLEPYRPK